MILAANVLNADRRPTAGRRPRSRSALSARAAGRCRSSTCCRSPRQPLEAFLKVENPAYRRRRRSPTTSRSRRPRLHVSHAIQLPERPSTIGAFYAEIESGLRQLTAEVGEERAVQRRPLPADHQRVLLRLRRRTDRGHRSRPRRAAALQEVVEQGEGDMTSSFDADGDLAHYYRFEQLKYGRAYLAGDGTGIPTGPPLERRLRRRVSDARQPARPTSTPIRICAPPSDVANRNGRCCWSRSTRRSTASRRR